MENVVLFDVYEGGTAVITLNRPKALNSLSYDMVKPIGEHLTKWAMDEQVKVVIVKGAGEKGFCAGGDIKTLYEARKNDEAKATAMQFFEEEYKVDMQFYHYKKPIIAVLDGIVMGGGVGLTYGASHRIVTERTKWAMPEMNIGFFPDVGAEYFLNKAPGHIGRYLALTASVIPAQDVLFANAADIFMQTEQLTAFLTAIEHTKWQGDSTAQLDSLIAQYASQPADESVLQTYEDAINKHFNFDNVEAIIASLANDPSEFAQTTCKQLQSVSPSSLKITLKQIIDGQQKTMEECFATNLTLAKNFLTHADFYEGVRSVVIDKDRNPNYKYKTLADFSDEAVTAFFK